MTDIPVIETERLILRGHRPSDTEDFIAAMADNDFARRITREGRGLTREEAWRNLSLVNGSWSMSGFGNWVAEEKASGRPIGRLGPFSPPGWPDFEIGWAIFPEFQRRGFGSEGAAAAMVWCREALDRDYVIHCILMDNEPSQKLAEGLGGRFERKWEPPWGGDVGVWKTTWEAFTESAPYKRHIANSG